MKKRILYFYTNPSSFVKKDIEMFAKKYSVKPQGFYTTQKFLTPFLFLRQLAFLAVNIFSCDIIISRFVGYHSLFPLLFGKLSGKPTVCIMGGTECISFPSVKVGNFNKPLYGLVTRWCLRKAAHLCPVHESLVLSDYTYQDNDYKKQGYKFFCPEVKTPCTVIHNGFDEKKFFSNAEKIPNTFITVCAGLEQKFVMELKGIDLILAVAPFFPECKFLIIGSGNPESALLKGHSANVEFIPAQPNEKLVDYYSKAEFYMQLSLTEGFPNALCEAMLCGCVPIASGVGGMPDIVRDCGYLLKRKDLNMLKDLVKSAIADDKKVFSEMARKKIVKNYSLQLRAERFNELFEKL